MKNLYLIGGTMGVGKTTVSQQLKKLLPRAVFLDGDWCWDADPFQVTGETKEMVMDNICHVLNNFLRCPAYENVIFCWVMDRGEILEELLGRLDVDPRHAPGAAGHLELHCQVHLADGRPGNPDPADRGGCGAGPAPAGRAGAEPGPPAPL